MVDQPENKILSVPEQVFDNFLKELDAKNIPSEVIARLKKTFIDSGQISVKSLKMALFPNESSEL